MSPIASVGSVRHANKPFRRPAFRVSQDFPTDSVDATTLPDLIHFNCQYNPDHLFALQEVSHQGNLIHISFRELQDVTVACARLFAKSLITTYNGDADARRPVALFLESDVVLFIHLGALLYLEIPVCPHVQLKLKRILIVGTGYTLIHSTKSCCHHAFSPCLLSAGHRGFARDPRCG